MTRPLATASRTTSGIYLTPAAVVTSRLSLTG